MATSSTPRPTRNAGIVVSKPGANVAAALAEIAGIATPTAANIVRGITSVFSVSADAEADRVRIVQAFNADGITGGRGMAAAAAKLNGGATVRGFSKSTADRYQKVATAIARDDAPKLTDAQGVTATAALVTLANYGEDIVAAVDLAIKAGKGAAFVKSLTDAVKGRERGDYAEMIAPAKGRAVGGTANVSDKGTGKGDTPAPDETPEPTKPGAIKTRDGHAAPLMSVSTARLIVELTRRNADDWDTASVDALTELAARIESIIESRNASEESDETPDETPVKVTGKAAGTAGTRHARAARKSPVKA